MSERVKNTLHYDVLEGIFEMYKFYSTIFFRSEMVSPWGISLDSVKSLRFHISMKGNFFIGPDDTKHSFEIQEKGVVILPTGRAHWIADRPGRKLINSMETSFARQINQDLFEQKTVSHSLMCGLIQFDEQTMHPLFNSLPDIIHIPPIVPSSTIWQLIDLIDRELNESDSLCSMVVDRLSEILFIKLLLEYIKLPGETMGFFSALQDRRLHFVIQLMHQHMHEKWTIKKLAHQSGMSRATLVRRFRKSVGIPPIEYLTQWRLLKTHNMLKYSNKSLEEISKTVGFASNQTLSKAFKRHYGYTPVSLRKVNSESAEDLLITENK